MFENPRRGRHARKFTKSVPKILDLKSSSEQIFSENWRKVSLVIRWWRVDLLMAVSQDVSHMNGEFSVAQSPERRRSYVWLLCSEHSDFFFRAACVTDLRTSFSLSSSPLLPFSCLFQNIYNKSIAIDCSWWGDLKIQPRSQIGHLKCLFLEACSI